MVSFGPCNAVTTAASRDGASMPRHHRRVTQTVTAARPYRGDVIGFRGSQLPFAGLNSSTESSLLAETPSQPPRATSFPATATSDP